MHFNRCLRSLVVCAAGLHLSDGFLTPLAVQVRRPKGDARWGRVRAGADGTGGAPCDKRDVVDVLGSSKWSGSYRGVE